MFMCKYCFSLVLTIDCYTVLVFPKGKMLSTFGDRTCSMAAPKLWNALPAELCSISSLSAFKSSLKTHDLVHVVDDLVVLLVVCQLSCDDIGCEDC